MLNLRTLLFWANLLAFLVSILVVSIIKGIYIGGISALAFLPAGILVIVWLSQDDIVNPLAGVWLAVFFGMSLRTAYMVLSSSERADTLMWRLSFSDLATGSWIATFGCLAIVAGYLVARPLQLWPSSAGTVLRLRQDRLFWISAMAGIIAAIAAADFLRRTGFDLSGAISAKRRVATDSASVQGFESLGYHRWLASTIPGIFFYIWFWNAQRTRDLQSKLMALLFFLFVSGFAFLCSSRSTICLLMLNGVYIMHASGSLRLYHFAVVGAAAVVVISLMLAMRQAGRQGNQTTASDVIGITAITDSVLGNENFADLARLTRIYKSVPDLMPYKYGISYLTWLFAPVPRSMWPEKPVLSQGLEVSERIYGSRRFATGIEGGGRPPGFLGEVIMNFGWYGIPFLSFIYGVVLRLLQNFQQTNRRGHVMISVFLFMPLSFELMSSEFSRILVNCFLGLAPTLVLLRIAAQRGRIYAVTESFEGDGSLALSG